MSKTDEKTGKTDKVRTTRRARTDEKQEEAIFDDIAEEVSQLAAVSSDKKRAFDAAHVAINSRLIGAALSGLKTISSLSKAIEALTGKAFDISSFDDLDPKTALRLLTYAVELYKTQVGVAQMVLKETDWEKLSGLITELRLYEEAANKGVDDDLIRAIAEELASRLETEDVHERLESAARKIRKEQEEKNEGSEGKKAKSVKKVKKVKRVKKAEKEDGDG